MSLTFNRRSFLRGMLGGTAVCVGLPVLDLFLNGNGTAFADGAKLPVRFGTYFWGLGLTDTPTGGTRWVPSKTGPGYEIMPELESLKPREGQGFGVLRLPRDRRRPGEPRPLERPCLDPVRHRAGRDGPVRRSLLRHQDRRRHRHSTRFKVIDVDASMSRQPVSYSTRTGGGFATPETTPLALYTRLFGAGFQDPNSDNWKPDPSIMLRQSVLSAVKEQRAGADGRRRQGRPGQA